MEERDPKNPYAAPKAKFRRRRSDEDSAFEARFEPMRMSVAAVFALSFVTIGLYAWYWLFTRRRFIDSLDSTEKLGMGLLSAALGTNLVATGLTFASEDFVPLRTIISLGSTVLWFVAVFRIVKILRIHFARNGIHREISGVATFFLTTLYLQYVFNRAADAELAMATDDERRRRRKKKKKKREPAPATVEADEADEADEAT